MGRQEIDLDNRSRQEMSMTRKSLVVKRPTTSRKRSVRPTMTSRRLVNYTTVASAMLAILGVRTVEGGYETRYSRLMLNVNAASPGSSYTKIPKQNYGGSSYTVIPRQGFTVPTTVAPATVAPTTVAPTTVAPTTVWGTVTGWFKDDTGKFSDTKLKIFFGITAGLLGFLTSYGKAGADVWKSLFPEVKPAAAKAVVAKPAAAKGR